MPLCSQGSGLPKPNLVSTSTQYLENIVIMLCGMAWRLALEPRNDEYSNLKTCEFVHFHGVWVQLGNLCSFRAQTSCNVAHLESLFSHINDWSKKFFFISGTGWEFLVDEARRGEFPVHAIWGQILDGNTLDVTFLQGK